MDGASIWPSTSDQPVQLSQEALKKEEHRVRATSNHGFLYSRVGTVYTQYSEYRYHEPWFYRWEQNNIMLYHNTIVGIASNGCNINFMTMHDTHNNYYP